jgi:hypothetical protein
MDKETKHKNTGSFFFGDSTRNVSFSANQDAMAVSLESLENDIHACIVILNRDDYVEM